MSFFNRPRIRGLPTSSNRASSFHVFWDTGSPEPVVEVSASLTIEQPPAVDRLYFWALQASFTDGSGRRYGAGHLGLQWHPDYPGNTAANWGGYGSDGTVLDGSESPNPSALRNPHTRNFAWEPRRPYRLTIRRTAGAAEPGWAGLVDGLELRTLYAPGDRLDGPMVWSEVFARCDDPSVTVLWSDLEVVTAAGARHPPAGARLNYQSRANGGCDNTRTEQLAPGTYRQTTNVSRTPAR